MAECCQSVHDVHEADDQLVGESQCNTDTELMGGGVAFIEGSACTELEWYEAPEPPCVEGSMNDSCDGMCVMGEWVEVAVDCAEDEGVPCEAGWVPAEEGACCSTCPELPTKEPELPVFSFIQRVTIQATRDTFTAAKGDYEAAYARAIEVAVEKVVMELVGGRRRLQEFDNTVDVDAIVTTDSDDELTAASDVASSGDFEKVLQAEFQGSDNDVVASTEVASVNEPINISPETPEPTAVAETVTNADNDDIDDTEMLVMIIGALLAVLALTCLLIVCVYCFCNTSSREKYQVDPDFHGHVSQVTPHTPGVQGTSDKRFPNEALMVV